LFNNNTFLKIKLVNTLSADSEQDLTNKHINFVNDNYEGSIVRTISGKYKCKARSLDLLKYKDFDDAEFKIVGFTSEKDTSKKDDDLIVWICKTIDDNTFNVRPKGTKEERQMLYKRGQDFIGRNLHVKYFELTESKVPRFPTTKSETYSSYIRDIIE
jgi:DNA ligase-1